MYLISHVWEGALVITPHRVSQNWRDGAYFLELLSFFPSPFNMTYPVKFLHFYVSSLIVSIAVSQIVRSRNPQHC